MNSKGHSMEMLRLHTKLLEKYSISFLELTVRVTWNKENIPFFNSQMQSLLFSLQAFVYCTKRPLVK